MRVKRFIAIGVFCVGFSGCAGGFLSQLRLNPPLAQGTFQDRLRVTQISRVAVLPFENLTPSEGASDGMADMFSTALYGAKRFSILERVETVRRAKQEGVAIPATIDRATALRVGKALQVDGIFVGTVTEYQYLFYPEDAVVGLKIELLDVESGQVVWSGIFNDRHYGIIQGSDEPITNLARAGAAQLVTLLSPPVTPQYPYTPVNSDPLQHTERLSAQAEP